MKHTNWELSETLSNTCTHTQGVMDSESHDGSSLSIPLVLNQKQNEIAEAKADGDQASTKTTGFFKTCFNGLNALTGWFLYFYYIYILSKLNPFKKLSSFLGSCSVLFCLINFDIMNSLSFIFSSFVW